MRKLIFFSSAIIAFCSSAIALADSCSIVANSAVSFLPATLNPEDKEIDIKANDAELVKDGLSVFTGDVEARQAKREIQSDRATYHHVSGDITATGDVRIRGRDVILYAQKATWSMTEDKGDATEASYLLRESNARGTADTIHQHGDKMTVLDDATYTTCPPGDNAWQLSGSTVDLNHEKAVGVARHAVLRLGGFPVFYSPYVTFPLNDDRKSGFLTPSFGTSSKLGTEISVPYYWNIAENKDATLTVHNMSKRGLMLAGEFRYLTQKSSGIFTGAYLPTDDLRADGFRVNKNYNQNRKHVKWRHNTQFTPRLYTDIDYGYVSDKEYLADFGGNLALASATHIKRALQVGYNANHWGVTGRLESYQTLGDATKPYQRLPELSFKGSLPNKLMGLSYDLTAKYVNFDHDTKIRTHRVSLEPSVSLPLRSSAGFLIPRVAINHTHYDLSYKDDNRRVKGDKSLTRTLPIFSVDSGLFFDRDTNIWSVDYLHTLEPRIFYLNVPYRDQSHIPVFDSGLRSFNMGQLFTYDRFSGGDRIGDTDQVSLSVTSRVINKKTGRENFRFSVGQIQYFEDRNVALTGTGKNTLSNSDIITEAVLSPSKEWKISNEIHWDTYDGRYKTLEARLRYRSQHGSLFNITHRYHRDSKEQIDVSTYLPLNHKWSIMGRWYYSLKRAEHHTLESLFGIQYDTCCWTARLIGRDYYASNKADKKLYFGTFFQIELKGLGVFGQKTEELLRDSILGY